jgi:hypothetical protein
MKTIEYLKKSFLCAAGTLIYISLVAWLLSNGQKLFGDVEKFFLIPVFMLSLLVLSAAITGILMFGQPISLYLDGKKKESVRLLFANLGWLLLFIIIIATVIALK